MSNLPPVYVPEFPPPTLPPHLPWPRFELGELVATPAALELLKISDTSPLDIIQRHGALDPGDLPVCDVRANADALTTGARIMSAYTVTVAGQAHKVWAITDAAGDDGCRASTCVLLPGDY